MTEEETNIIQTGNLLLNDERGEILKVIRGWYDHPRDHYHIVVINALEKGWADPKEISGETKNREEVMEYEFYTSFDQIRNEFLRSRIMAYEVRSLKKMMYEGLGMDSMFEHFV